MQYSKSSSLKEIANGVELDCRHYVGRLKNSESDFDLIGYGDHLYYLA